MFKHVCNCDPSIFDNEALRYEKQVLLELPEGMVRDRRLREGLSSQVCIDPCIVDHIKYIWSLGIETLGCCCGHNTIPGWVGVPERQTEKMKSLGYVQDEQNKMFYL